MVERRQLHLKAVWIGEIHAVGTGRASQCLYTIAGGYLCRLIARSRRVAMAGLIGLGILVGTFSLSNSWSAEPHWYGIALFVAFPPCVWIGWTLAI